MKKIILFAVLLCLSITNIQAQTTRYLKPVASGTGDGSSWANASANFQLMINSSAPGDFLFMAAGTYQPAFEQSFAMKEGVKIYGGFAGTESLLTQRDWVSNVTILLGNNRSVIYNDFALHLTSATVLDGFTITGGNAVSGGGMYNDYCSPTISNCIFSFNSGTGGGMRNSDCSPNVSNCTFSNNTGGTGGGIYNSNANPTLTNCTFNSNTSTSNNYSGVGGGAIFNQASSPVINRCHFYGNSATTASGGAIYSTGTSLFAPSSITDCDFQNNTAIWGGAISHNDQSAVSFTNCLFQNNNATNNAGAMFNVGSVTITRCSFLYNTATIRAGAMDNLGFSPVISYCTFSGNSSQSGAVMDNDGSNPLIRSCLFSGNKAQFYGSVIQNRSSAAPVISNCTFAGNNDGDNSGAIYNLGGAAAAINNSIIWGNSSGIYNEASAGITTVQYSIIQGGYVGTGNLNADPGFSNIPSYTLAPYNSGDFRMSSCSPACNTGSNALVPGSLVTDLAGRPRVLGTTVDMGAYEAGLSPGPGNILYVNPDLPFGSSNGYADSWSNATWFLSGALQFAKQNESLWTASNPLKIFVAKSVQKPMMRPENTCNFNINDRNNTFLLVNNVQLYGGFDPANGIDDLSDARIFGAGGTILSGDLGLFGNNSDNSYHVITSSGAVNNAIVDGFTITGGNANGAGSITVNGNTIPNNNGGGIYHHASAPVYANCAISGNNASNFGGGIFNEGSSPVITACSITNNNSPYGGGMLNNGAAPVVTNTTFSFNQSASYGGGVYNSGASASYSNCTFSNNSTINGTGGGGAIFNNTATPIISNCSFTGNSGDYGGGIYNYAASVPTITGCSFITNLSGSYGGAIFSEAAASPAITDSRFSGNTSGYGGALFNHGATAIVKGCSFSGNQAVSYGGAVYNNGSGAVSSYTNCVFAGNTSVNGGGGAVFNNGSLPTITNCTFRGNNATFGGAIHNWATAAASVRNSIIWGNSSAIYNESAASASVQYSIVQGGYTGTGNLNTDPLFVNTGSPTGPDAVWGTLDDGLRLQPCSPAINAGNNTLVPGGIITDASATPRIQFITVDIGAYEVNSLADNAAAAIVNTNTTATAWQIANGTTYYASNCTALIASVTGNGTGSSISGNTTARVWIESSQPADFVKRHYEITPQANAGTATADITLYFTQAEFDAFNAVNTVKLPQGPADAIGKGRLRIEKRGGISGNGSGLPNSYAGATTTINPDDANIVWNAIAFRWEISFGVAGFSGFFLKTNLFTLPLRLVKFTAEEKNCSSHLLWTTADENSVSYFEVEQSADGIVFGAIKKIAAKNAGAETDYEVAVPVMTNKIYYRLKIVDIDGRVTYSGVVQVSSMCEGRAFVYPNPAKDKLYLQNATVGKRYAIYDNMGRLARTGLIHNNLQGVDIARLAPGVYYIGMGETEKWKFVKE